MPKSDTCSTCDTLKIRIDSEEDEEKKSQLRLEQELHHRKAKAFQDYMKEQGEQAKAGEISVLAFDLQQSFPTPKLSCGPACYKRKIWTLNEGVHNLGTDTGYMYVWSEDEGNRGSDEVGSILLNHLQSMDTKEDLVVFSDNCKGQNKNWTIMALWFHLVKEKKFRSITHVFVVTGHTHLPCDRDFGLIEKASRRKEHVYSPEEWITIIGSIKIFQVKTMSNSDFKQISLLPIRRSAKTTEGRKVEFSKAQIFRFDEMHPGKMLMKTCLSGCFEEVFIEPMTRTLRLGTDGLPAKYSETLKLKSAKLRDVKSLLPFVPPVHHAFYNNLKEDASLDSDETEDIDERS